MSLNNKIKNNIELAAKLARKYPHDSKYHFCSLLIKKNKVISVGFNSLSKTHPRAKKIGNTIHSELHCLLGVREEHLRGATLIVVKMGFQNRSKRTMAKPCTHCQKIIECSPIRDVYYSISDEKIGLWNVKSNNFTTIKI